MNCSPTRYEIVCGNCTQSNDCSVFLNFANAYVNYLGICQTGSKTCIAFTIAGINFTNPILIVNDGGNMAEIGKKTIIATIAKTLLLLVDF